MKIKNIHSTVLYYNGDTFSVGEEFEVDENDNKVKRWLKAGVVETVKSKKTTKKKDKEVVEFEPEEDEMAEPTKEITGDE